MDIEWLNLNIEIIIISINFLKGNVIADWTFSMSESVVEEVDEDKVFKSE